MQEFLFHIVLIMLSDLYGCLVYLPLGRTAFWPVASKLTCPAYWLMREDQSIWNGSELLPQGNFLLKR
jgi:hypothetical protein